MKYLLDVNVLVAICVETHEFHGRVSRWIEKALDSGELEFLTCSLTELGFLRVLTQTAAFSFTIEHGKQFLSQLKSSPKLGCKFLADTEGAAELPGWVKGPKQITDGHLVELAKSNDAKFATLDQNIPGAVLIPTTR
jgi:hypothetical protein